MSGVAEGVAGLTLSAVSVAALFTTVVQCFDIVVAGKNFGEDFEQLCTLVRYNKNLDRPDIRPGIERTLNNIKSLLDAASQVDDRYGSSQGVADTTPSRGLDVFRISYERFKSNITRNQKKTSSWNLTRWAIHDAKKFEISIARLKEFVDGLESITKSLGLLEEQRAKLRQEIESIPDTESLRLLRDASSRHGSSDRDIADTASHRLITVTESISERGREATSHKAARRRVEKPSIRIYGDVTNLALAGGFIKVRNQTNTKMTALPRTEPFDGSNIETASSYEGTPDSFVTAKSELSAEICTSNVASPPSSTPTRPVPTPRTRVHQSLSFARGDLDYGKALSTVKAEDEAHWNQKSINFLTQASSGSSAAKRMFFELRNIKAGKVPFVSATPVGDNLTKVLASIEGPLETPYEGGIFWIAISLPDENPHAPILMRFHTKIYHPNISPRGDICADYSEKWTSVLSGAGAERAFTQKNARLWYQRNKNNQEWTLGALLTAICGLLATPDVEDPLVPEIAQKYVENYDEYVKNAVLYTQRFATAGRPPDDQLQFPEKVDVIEVPRRSTGASSPTPISSSWPVYIVEPHSSISPENYAGWDVHEFLRTARDQVEAANGLIRNPSDLELTFAICEKAKRVFQQLGNFSLGFPNPCTYFASARQRCTEYIIGILKPAQVQVSRHEDGPLFSMRICIMPDLSSWTLVRTVEEVIEIFEDICGRTPSPDVSKWIQNLCWWCSNRTPLASSCLVYIRLLELILNDVFSHTPQTLNEPKVLSFFYPQGILEDEVIKFGNSQKEEKDVIQAPRSHLGCTICSPASLSTILSSDVTSRAISVLMKAQGEVRKGTAFFEVVNKFERANLRFCFFREGERFTTSADMELEFDSLKDMSIEKIGPNKWCLQFWYKAHSSQTWAGLKLGFRGKVDAAREWEAFLRLFEAILPAQRQCQESHTSDSYVADEG